MKTRIVLLVASIMLLAGGAGVATKWQVKARRNAHPAYTLHSRVTQFLDDGSQYVTEKVRYVSSDGGYHIVDTDNGKIREFFFALGRGYFNVNHRDKKLIRRTGLPNSTVPPAPTAEQLRSDPQFHHTEVVLGLDTYVHRIMNKQTGQPAVDYYFTEELGPIPLKMVTYYNGRVGLIVEPVSVTFGEPDASLVKLPDYAIENQ